MTVKVRLFATLRENRGKEVIVEGPEGMTCRDVVEKLSISKDDIAILLINGRDGRLEATLAMDDVVSIFPPVGGG